MKLTLFTTRFIAAGTLVVLLLPNASFAAPSALQLLDSINADDNVTVEFEEEQEAATPTENNAETTQAIGRVQDALRTFIGALSVQEQNVRANTVLGESTQSLFISTISEMRTYMQSQMNAVQGVENTETLRGMATQMVQFAGTRSARLQQQRGALEAQVNEARNNIGLRGDRIVEVFRVTSGQLAANDKDVTELNAAIDSLEGTLSSIGQAGTDNAAAIATAREQITSIKNQIDALK